MRWFLPLLLLAHGTAWAASPQPKFDKIMIVIFENTDYDHALARTFFAKLAREGALLTGYYAVAHPSQPNYIAIAAGDTLGVASDKNAALSAVSLADTLSQRGRTWKIYAEGYPGACFLKARSGKYARKHVPFLSFTRVTEDPAQCAKVVNSAQLDEDVKNDALPDVSLYIPDLNDDGHDTGVAYANTWYERRFTPLLADPKFARGLLLVTTFDEDEDAGGTNRIYTSLYGAGVAPGAVSPNRYDHYSLTRLVEDRFGLKPLGRKDAQATPISGVWK